MVEVMSVEVAAASPVCLDENAELRRVPLGADLERPPEILARFDDRVVFHDVFRDVSGGHVYFIGPMAINLEPLIDRMTVVGHPSGRHVRPRIHHGAQAVIGRASLPASDTEIAFEIGGQVIRVAIQPNRAENLAGERVIFTMNKDNRLAWIVDWARFYVREHGATAVAIYDNGSTDYTAEQLTDALRAVEGLRHIAVIPWPYRFGWMDDVYDKHRYGASWAMFAQPPMFTQFWRKYAARARSIVNVDIDEFVLSPFRKSIFRAVERSSFGTIRFNRLWVENIRIADGEPRHYHFRVRKKGRGSKDVGKKWALAPGYSWLASWRAQLWTHQIYGWLNLSGSTTNFYCYHFIGISRSWYWDRTKRPDFDPRLHTEDKLLRRALIDTYGEGD